MGKTATPTKLTILAVDDQPEIGHLFTRMLSGGDYLCVSTTDGHRVLDLIEKHHPFLVLLDMFIADVNGLDVLCEIKTRHPDILVVIITGSPTVESAVTAMQSGALDYLVKPLIREEVLLRVRRAREHYELLSENRNLRTQLKKEQSRTRLIGDSAPLRKVLDTIQAVAATDVHVLISGESGTGKELVARAIHEQSPRAERPFVPVDCVALPETLLTSELFGYEKGAFTGANEKRLGLFEMASRGTLFLDEITELSMDLQAKLLRVLQEKQFRRIGGQDLIGADVRIISATNREPQQAVRDNRLRLDLYYRLNVVPVIVPPLRDRTEDIPLLADHFLFEFAEMHHRPAKKMTGDALELLKQQPWPGNVRELKNLMHRLVIMLETDVLDAAAVRTHLGQEQAAPATAGAEAEELFTLPYKEAKRKWESLFDRRYLPHLLKTHHGVVSRAADAAGVDRKTLARLMTELDIPARDE